MKTERRERGREGRGEEEGERGRNNGEEGRKIITGRMNIWSTFLFNAPHT